MDAAESARLTVRRALLAVILLTGCAATQPLEPMDRPVDLERFMGDWYVQAHIPIDIPFFSESKAYNGVESYRLTADGTIETTYRFREGSFDGPEVVLTPRGWVHDEETAAEWRMQFLWPFRSAYLIVALDDEYRDTIVGVPSRRYAWIMSRAPVMSDTRLRELETELERLGYDLGKLRRMPQRWPQRETPPHTSAAQ